MTDKKDNEFTKGCLVLYKSAPAAVIDINDKIKIELEDKKNLLVRPKDISFLHPGPVSGFQELKKLVNETDQLKEACSLLQGENTSLKELAGLTYNEYTAESAWAVCSQLIDGLYIEGSTDRIIIRAEADVEKDTAARKQKEKDKSRWADFTVRVKQGKILPDDSIYIKDLEQFALGKQNSSKLLKDLKMPETAENAHSMLLKLNHWDNYVNPYISRFGFSAENNYPSLGLSYDEILSKDRLDLTHLDAFAVDDEGNEDPDDAVSFENGKLWIHIADPSSAALPGSEADNYAMNQGSKIYLPEIRIPMLSDGYTDSFALGLNPVSPAISFCIRLNNDGSIGSCEIFITKIKVKRMTYQQAQQQLGSFPFNKIHEAAILHKKYRISNGASFFSFPEVKIKVKDNKVSITPYMRFESAEMIAEAMLMAGEGAARYAAERNIPFIYSTQAGSYGEEAGADRGQEPSGKQNADSNVSGVQNADSNVSEVQNAGININGQKEEKMSLSAMFTLRRKMSAGEVKSQPGRHSGLGLESYSRVTSPLRRYSDLAVHQQLRLYLEGKELLSGDEIITKTGRSAAGAAAVQKLERVSNMHWTLVYLLQNPDWAGKGIVVDKKERSDNVIIPELGFETSLPARKNRTLDEEVTLKVEGIDLPKLNAYFKVV